MSALRPARAAYRHFLAIPTRWMDNDSYGHVNNVTYYSYFDTAVNEHLVRAGGLDIANDPVIGLVVETSCTFHASLSFPETIDAGLAITRLGGSSVAYRIGLFRRGTDWNVLVVGRGRAVLRKVELASRSGATAAIAQGLKAGETVVLFPSTTLKPGMAVSPR